jgi:hypothetical protein
MEYTHIIQPMILIGISFGIGAVLGSFWMFCIMYTKEKRLEKELDSKNALLDTYINTYEDDGYEAY